MFTAAEQVPRCHPSWGTRPPSWGPHPKHTGSPAFLLSPGGGVRPEPEAQQEEAWGLVSPSCPRWPSACPGGRALRCQGRVFHSPPRGPASPSSTPRPASYPTRSALRVVRLWFLPPDLGSVVFALWPPRARSAG